MPGHADDDARFHNRQQAYVHARGIAPIHLKPELTIAGSRRSGSAGGGRVVINLGVCSFLGIHCKTLYVNRRDLVGP